MHTMSCELEMRLTNFDESEYVVGVVTGVQLLLCIVLFVLA